MYIALYMAKETTLYIPPVLTEDIRQLLVKERDDIAKSITERERLLTPDKEKLLMFDQLIRSMDEAQPDEVSENDEYSYKWRTPVKTMYILKYIIKRPASANEVIAAIELKDNGKGETKKTTVFSALANQAEAGQLVKSKPGNENLYCHTDYVRSEESSFKDQLNLIK